MRTFQAVALLIGLGLWATPASAFSDVEDGSVFVRDPQAAGYVDAHVLNRFFPLFCLEQTWEVSSTKTRDGYILACTIPNSEDMAGKRTDWTFKVYFREFGEGKYKLEKITNPKGVRSAKDTYDFVKDVHDFAEKAGLK